MPENTDTKQEAGTVSNSSSTDLLVDVFFSNNDYDLNLSPSEMITEMGLEANTATKAGLFLRYDLTKDQALREIDNLKWLVEQRFCHHK